MIYTGGSKLAEHGGFSYDHRNTALLVAGPGMTAKVVQDPVLTTQIVAPTILRALDIDPQELQSVQIEHTTALPGLPEQASRRPRVRPRPVA